MKKTLGSTLNWIIFVPYQHVQYHKVTVQLLYQLQHGLGIKAHFPPLILGTVLSPPVNIKYKKPASSIFIMLSTILSAKLQHN